VTEFACGFLLSCSQVYFRICAKQFGDLAGPCRIGKDGLLAMVKRRFQVQGNGKRGCFRIAIRHIQSYLHAAASQSDSFNVSDR